MRAARTLRRWLLSAFALSLLGCAFIVAAGIAAPTTSAPDLTGYFPPGNGLTVNAFVDAKSSPGTTLYRFDTVIQNSSTAGILDLYKPSGASTAYQAVWSTGLPPSAPIGKTAVPTGATLHDTGGVFAYSAATGHNHWHFPKAAAYQLLTSAGGVVADSPKNLAGFCLYDSWDTPGNPVYFQDGTYCQPNDPGYTGVIRMGIAPGKGDFYGNQLADQWVEVQGVEPRTDYRLSMKVNPTGGIQESNTANDTTTTDATIIIPGGRAAPASATTPAGQAVQISLPGSVVGANVRSRKTATCDMTQAACYETASSTALTYALATPPPAAQGAVTISGSTATFTPAAGFTGTSQFTYTATDSRGLAGPPATVSVSVTGTGPGPAVTVSVSPGSASVQTGATRQFTATATGTTDPVVWSVNGVTGGNATVGTISSSGLYTAPGTVPGAAVTVRATHAASGAFGTAAVTVTGAVPPPSPRDPNALPLADSFTGADAGPPAGPLWSPTPLWSGQKVWKRISNQAGPSAGGWNDAYLTGAVGRPVGIRMQVAAPPPSGSILFTWLVASGQGASPSGYALRLQRGSSDTFQLQRWSSGAATYLGGATVSPIAAGSWLALIADSTGVEAFRSADGSTWTSIAKTSDTSLGGNLSGGMETNAPTTRVDNVGYGNLGSGPPPPPITVSVSPQSATVQTGATQQFTAAVTGTTDPVVWSVNGVTGGNATVGTISSTGLYTAPAAAPASALTIRATHPASGTSGSATVSVTTPPAAVTVAVSPASASVQTGATRQFTATVTGTTDPVVWSVNGVTGGNATVGTVSSSGLYTAPAAVPSGAVTVRATHAASGASGQAAVTVTTPPAAVTVAVSPASASVQTGATRQFTATLTGTTDPVVWSVNGVTGGNATVGTISSSGLYTAPGTVPGAAVTVRATHAASGAFGTAAVTVTGAVPPPSPRDPNALPLADSFTGADAGPPAGPLWSPTPLWSGQKVWKRISNQAGPSASGWNDAYLTGAVGRPVGIRMQVAAPPPSGSILFTWLVASGQGASPSGYALRLQRGTSDTFQLQRWNTGAATYLGGATVSPIAAGSWLALIADSTGVEAFRSADGSTWTSLAKTSDTSLGGNLSGGMETNAPTTRVNNVGYGNLGS